MTLRFSKSVRTQILCLDLVQAVIDSIPKGFEHEGLEIPTEARKSLTALSLAHRHIMSSMTGGTGRYQLVKKDYDAYKRELAKLEIVIAAVWGHKEISALEFLNAVLLVVSDVTDQIPKKPMIRRIRWIDLFRAMLKVYELYDPDYEAQEQERGHKAGEIFQAVVFGKDYSTLLYYFTDSQEGVKQEELL